MQVSTQAGALSQHLMRAIISLRCALANKLFAKMFADVCASCARYNPSARPVCRISLSLRLCRAAVSGGHIAVVELLVGNGAEVDRAYSVSGWTSLHQAAFKVRPAPASASVPSHLQSGVPTTATSASISTRYSRDQRLTVLQG